MKKFNNTLVGYRTAVMREYLRTAAVSQRQNRPSRRSKDGVNYKFDPNETGVEQCQAPCPAVLCSA